MARAGSSPRAPSTGDGQRRKVAAGRSAPRFTLYRQRPLSDAERAMFVIELIYKVALSEIDKHMAAHVRFLKKHYATGHFLVSGRKIPRDGGIIVAVGKSRDEIEAIIKEDPFCARGLADVRVIEFRASQRADDIEARMAQEKPSHRSSS